MSQLCFHKDVASIKLLQDWYVTEFYIIRRSGKRFERFVQHWIICSTTLNDLYYVEWFALCWMIFITLTIFTKLNDFLLCCKICTTSNDLYSVDKFVLSWMIRNAMGDLYNIESSGLRLIIEYRLFNKFKMCLFDKILEEPHMEYWIL